MTKQQKVVLIAAILASFVAFLDLSVVNVALPAISRELGGGLAAQQWIVDAYLVMLGSLILIAGSLADLFGRRRIMILGLIGFGVTSLLCAFAISSQFLIASRLLQGVAGALLVPTSLAVIIATFTGTAQAKAIGSWTAWTGIAFIIGPLLGGWLVDSVSWRLVFAINVLPIAITLWLLRGLRGMDKTQSKVKVDIRGAIFCALGLGGTVFALIEQPHYGWTNPLIWLSLSIGLLAFIYFLVYERKAKEPMLPYKLFNIRNFSAGNLATLFIYAALTAGFFVIVVFLQQVSGYSALAAGMALLPPTLLLFLFSSRVGGLSGKFGPRIFMTLGPIIAGVGFLMLLKVTAAAPYWRQVFPGVLVFSIGLTLTVTPLVSAVLGKVDNAHAGIASAINNAIARVAGLLAVAAIGALIAWRFDAVINQRLASLSEVSSVTIATAKIQPLSLVPGSEADNQRLKSVLQVASVDAFHLAIATMGGLLIVGGLVSAVGIEDPKPKQHAN